MRKAFVIAAASILLSVTAANGGCGRHLGPSDEGPTRPVTYTVEGKVASSITYNSRDGKRQQVSDVGLPWTKTINLRTGFAVVSVVARSSGPDPITCRIADADGVVIDEETGSGQSPVATCSGMG